jgi:hypothetical protein
VCVINSDTHSNMKNVFVIILYHLSIHCVITKGLEGMNKKNGLIIHLVSEYINSHALQINKFMSH